MPGMLFLPNKEISWATTSTIPDDVISNISKDIHRDNATKNHYGCEY